METKSCLLYQETPADPQENNLEVDIDHPSLHPNNVGITMQIKSDISLI